MKKKVLIFTIAFLYIGMANAQMQQLKLCIHSPKVIDSNRQFVEQTITIGANVRYTVSLVNISDQPVKVIDPNKNERWWGTHRVEEITTINEKSDTTFWFYEPADKPFSKRCVVDLLPKDSIIVDYAWVEINDTIPTKLVVNYEQFPKNVKDEVLNTLGVDFVKANTFRISSEPLYIKPIYPKVISDNLELSIEELSQPPVKKGSISFAVYGTSDLKELLRYYATNDYIQKAYKVSINDKSMKYIRFLPLIKNIRWLEIKAEYSLDSLPEGISQLDKLIYLSITGEIQESEEKKEKYIEPIKNLKNLQEIKISNTFLKKTPEWLGNFQKLKKAYFSNAFQEYNAPLGKLTNIETLTLDGSLNKTLPVEIASLKKLKRLSLFKFSTQIDDSLFSALDNLENLLLNQYAAEYPNFTDCKVKTMILSQTLDNPKMPQGLSSNTYLDSLVLTYKSPEFPDISGCSNLRFIRVNNSVLETIPENISSLSNLQTLYLNTSNLKSLPDIFDKLSNLKTLNIENSKLTILPQSIGNAPGLIFLNIGRSLLSTFPEQITKLNNIESLLLRNNQMTEIPSSILKLTSLRLLYLDGNKLTTIPDELFNLPNLKVMWLTKNSFDKATQKKLQSIINSKEIEIHL